MYQFVYDLFFTDLGVARFEQFLLAIFTGYVLNEVRPYPVLRGKVWGMALVLASFNVVTRSVRAYYEGGWQGPIFSAMIAIMLLFLVRPWRDKSKEPWHDRTKH